MIGLLRRISSSLRQQGFAGTAAKMAGTLPEKIFDWRYGTDTCAISNLSGLTIASENREHGTRYEPTRVLSLQKLLPTIRQITPGDSVLVDLGCGKGRVLLLAAGAGFRTVRGLEFASELCEIARRNCETFKAKTKIPANFEIIHADVTTYPYRAEENVFFLFNPFDAVIFERVLSAIVHSWRKSRRQVFVVICLPTQQYRDAIAARPELALMRKVRCWGYDFWIYGSCEGGTSSDATRPA